MKVFSFLLVCIGGMTVCSCNDSQTAVPPADTKRDSFSIQVKINGVTGRTAKLLYNDPEYRTQKVLDSIPFTNGTFTLSGKLDYPGNA